MPKIIENLEIRLIQEAQKQIEHSGYGAVTIRSVAAGCGVGIGTVYNYFPSKDALVAAYMLQDWRNCMGVIAQSAQTADGPESVIRCIYEQLKQYAHRHQALFHDETAASAFAGSFSLYHAMLRSQLAQPLEHYCGSGFAAEFIAESLLTWTMAGTAFDELYGMIAKLL